MNPSLTKGVAAFASMALFLVARPGAGQVLHVTSGNSPFALAAPATYETVTVADGGLLVVNAPLTVNGDMTVGPGGLVTLDAGVYVLRLEVAGTLAVELGGAIDTYGLGLSPGVTVDPVTGTRVARPNNGAGGSHCAPGAAASGDSVYDDPFNPTLPGGGGTESLGGASGGGVLLLRTGALRLHGTLRADGEPAPSRSGGMGGAAGGAINVETQSLSGGGTLSATGGAGDSYGVGGAGGCVRIAFRNSTFTGISRVTGGLSEPGGPRGSAGSALLLDHTTNTATVAAGEFPLRAGQRVHAIAPAAGATLRVLGEAEVALPITVPPGAKVTLESPAALHHLNLGPLISGTVQVNADVGSAIGWTLTGRLVVNRRLTLPSLDAQAGAVITHDAGRNTMHLVVTGALDMAAGSRADAVGLGLAGGRTFEPLTLREQPGSMASNGGSHGGLGGLATPTAELAAIYDDPGAPGQAGGGGGAATGNSHSYGGQGGGVLRITAGLLALDGAVIADGAGSDFPFSPCGSGAGGSVVLRVGALRGAGAIVARGHQVATGQAGGGGGGLIHLAYATSTFTGTKSVAGGLGAVPGMPGVLTEVVLPMEPRIVSAPPLSAAPGQTYTYFASATGTVPLSWALDSAPDGATVDPASGAVHWLASATEGGADFELAASNASGVDRQAFRVEVRAAPDAAASTGPPRFTSTPDTAARCGVPYRYSGARAPTVSGAGPFAFSAVPALGVPLPDGLRVDAATGAFDWTPSPSDVGAHPLQLRVDGAEGSTRQDFAIIVECANDRLSVGCGCGASAASSLGLLGALMLDLHRRRRRGTC